MWDVNQRFSGQEQTIQEDTAADSQEQLCENSETDSQLFLPLTSISRQKDRTTHMLCNASEEGDKPAEWGSTLEKEEPKSSLLRPHKTKIWEKQEEVRVQPC